MLPPCVAGSGKKFSVVSGEIRFGLLGVKNVGEGVIDAILKLRRDKGMPRDFFQFINQIDIHEINKKAVESLIKAGAFDCLHPNRAQLMAVYEGLIESAQTSSRKNIDGQISLFQMNAEEMSLPGAMATMPDVKEFSKETLIALEKEMLGVYLTGHPLKDHVDLIEKTATVTSEELQHAESNPRIRDGMKVVMAGIISAKKILVTKSSKQMAFLDLEDLYGVTEVIVFPNIYERNISLIREDQIVVIKGTLNFKEDEQPKLIADGISDIRDIGGSLRGTSLKIRIPMELEEGTALQKLKGILGRFPGETPVYIKIDQTNKKFKAGQDLWVRTGDSLSRELEQAGFIMEV